MEVLPAELKKIICQYCQRREEKVLRLASTEWFNIVIYDFIAISPNESEWRQIADRLVTYKRPISLELSKNVISNLGAIIEQLTRLTNITSFALDGAQKEQKADPGYINLTVLTRLKTLRFPSIPFNVRKHFTFLEDIYFPEEDVLSADFVEAVQKMTNLRSLSVVAQQALERPFEMITTAHTNLTSLYISAQYDSEGSAGWTEEDLKRLRKLQVFSWQIENPNPGRTISMKYWTSLEYLCLSYPIDSSHLNDSTNPKITSLTSLFCALNGNSSWLTTLPQLQELDAIVASPEQFDILNHIRGASRLTELLLCFSGEFDKAQHDIFSENLTKLDHLVALGMDDFGGKVCVKNLTNLTLLTVSPKWPSEELYIEHLTDLTQLKYLALYSRNIQNCDLSKLPNLQQLYLLNWSPQIRGVECLQNLTSLHATFDENASFISSFTALRSVALTTSAHISPFLVPLTNLERILLSEISYEEDVLLFTAMQNLTSLGTHSHHFRGFHLTCLTSLRQFYFPGLNGGIRDRLNEQSKQLKRIQ